VGQPILAASRLQPTLFVDGGYFVPRRPPERRLQARLPAPQKRSQYNGAVRKFAVRKFDNFEDADRADREYYWSLTPQERLRIMCELTALGVSSRNDPIPRLARVYRIIELPRR
jgi:hypothetical protein